MLSDKVANEGGSDSDNQDTDCDVLLHYRDNDAILFDELSDTGTYNSVQQTISHTQVIDPYFTTE